MKPIPLNLKKSHVHYGSFAEALLQRHVLDVDQLKTISGEAEAAKVPLERYLVQKNLVDPAEFTLAVSAYFGMAPMTLPSSFLLPPDLFGFGTLDFWQKVKALPIAKTDGRVTVVFADPFDLPAQEEASRVVKGRLWPCVAAEKEVLDALARLKAVRDAANPALAMENIMKGQEADLEFTSTKDQEEAIDAAAETAGEAPVIRRVNTMLLEALKTRASDIHFEAEEK